MPAIETIPVPTYQPLDPYNHVYDNLPINGLIERISLVNNQVDNNTATLMQSIGTQGTLANRLAQSINPDGTLKTIAIDNALHSIAEHLDGGGYVRMTLSERSKLSYIAANATSLAINVETISGTLAFADTLTLGASDSIVWSYNDGKVAAETSFPASVRHNHYYGLVPVTSNYKDYTSTSVNTAYKTGSLRVYVNGIRLNTSTSAFVPFGLPGTITWTSMSYSEVTPSIGTFTLSSAITSSASIIIDFDVLYT